MITYLPVEECHTGYRCLAESNEAAAYSAVKIRIKMLKHRQQQWLSVLFPYNDHIKNRICTLPDRRYSKTHRCWYFPLSAQNLQLITDSLAGYPLEVDPAVSQHLSPATTGAPGQETVAEMILPLLSLMFYAAVLQSCRLFTCHRSRTTISYLYA